MRRCSFYHSYKLTIDPEIVFRAASVIFILLDKVCKYGYRDYRQNTADYD